jgi:hypothetical protein
MKLVGEEKNLDNIQSYVNVYKYICIFDEKLTDCHLLPHLLCFSEETALVGVDYDE